MRELHEKILEEICENVCTRKNECKTQEDADVLCSRCTAITQIEINLFNLESTRYTEGQIAAYKDCHEKLSEIVREK